MSTLSSDYSMPVLGTPAQRYDKWLLMLLCVCAGYIVFGRSFAYTGVPPLFIGEITILAGAACFLTLRSWRRIFQMSLTWLITALIALALLRTLPYLREYKVDAIRDFMLIGYASVAILAAGVIIDRPERLARVLDCYRRATPWIVLFVPIVWLVGQAIGDGPTLPWASNVPLLEVKPGDGQVHLGGALAFWCSGLAGPLPMWAIAAMAVGAPAMGTFNRGGLLSFALVGSICLALRPRAKALRGLAIIAILIGSAALLSNVTITMPGEKRVVSAQQFVSNIASVFGGSTDNEQLHGTKEWRLTWWRTIINYTIFGEEFWTGRGFGVNLADVDGFQVNEDRSLRSPHNGHLTVLARAGVPGLVLWLAVHGSFFAMLARGWMISRLRGDVRWNGLFLFLGAYALAFLFNASFDVFLEGPMGAIPFWTVFGVGMASLWCYRNAPHVLR